MKKYLFLMAVAFGLAACTNDISEPTNGTTTGNTDGITIYVTGAKPNQAGATKTHLHWESDLPSVLWDESGEDMDIYVSVDGEPDWGARYTSTDVTVTEGGAKASFKYVLQGASPESAEKGIRFHGIHPAYKEELIYRTMGKGEYYQGPLTIIPTVQYPAADSFDPSADVMIGISKEGYNSIEPEMTVEMVYDRLVTHGHILLRSFPVEYGISSIKKVIIMAPEDKTMTGMYYVDVFNHEFRDNDEAKQKNNYVILDYTHNTPADKEDDKKEEKGSDKESGGLASTGLAINEGVANLYFCTQPISIEAGEMLSLLIIDGNDNVYQKKITAIGDGIAFKKNMFSDLTIGCADITPVNPYATATQTAISAPDTDGRYDTVVIGSTNMANSVFGYDDGIYFETESFPDWANSVYVSLGEKTSMIDQNIELSVDCQENHNPSESRSFTGKIAIVKMMIDENGFYFGEDKVYLKAPNGDDAVFTITQAAGRGDLIIDGLSYHTFKLDGLEWYPLNIGITAEAPNGKLYQWGRKDGQNPQVSSGSTDNYYADGTYVIFGEADVDNPVTNPDADKVYAWTSNNRYAYSNGSVIFTIASKFWHYDDNGIEGKTQIPMCTWSEGVDLPVDLPEGWRLPTKEDFDKLLGVIKTADFYTYTKCVDDVADTYTVIPSAYGNYRDDQTRLRIPMSYAMLTTGMGNPYICKNSIQPYWYRYSFSQYAYFGLWSSSLDEYGNPYFLTASQDTYGSPTILTLKVIEGFPVWGMAIRPVRDIATE